MQMPRHDDETRYETDDNRSIGQLFSDLTLHVKTMVRDEMEMARIEMTQKVSGTVKDTILISAGGALLYAGLLTLLAAISIGLAAWLPLWLSTLLVAATVLIVGGILLVVGKNRLKERDYRPTQTIISLKENSKWIKRQT